MPKIPTGKPPFFIIGVPRSGTTLLSVMLGNHPDVYIDGDSVGRPLARLYRRYLRGDCTGDGVSRSAFLRQLMARSYKGRLQRLTEDVDWDADSESIQQYFYRVVHAFAERQGKKMWGDKTPELNFELEEITQLFPEAKFIHLLRDPRPNALSLSGRQLYPLPLAAAYWREINSLACAQRDLLGAERFMMLRYEDLLDRPVESMKKVCSFLELDFVEDVVDPGKNASTLSADAYVAPQLDKNRLEAWKRQMSEAQIKTVEGIVADLMLHFDYKPLLLNSAKPLSPFRIFLLRRKLMRKMLFAAERFQMVDRKWKARKIPFLRRLKNFFWGSAKQIFSKDFLRIFGYRD